VGFAIKQGEDICVALQTHINDVMLRRYSRTRNVPNGQAQGTEPRAPVATPKPPGIEVYEKHVQEMSKLLEESQRKIDQVIHSAPSLFVLFFEICVHSEGPSCCIGLTSRDLSRVHPF
jgi:hypothetical protein